MSLSMEFLGSEIQPAVYLSNLSTITTDSLISLMEKICDERSIPIMMRKDTVTSGSFFNKKTYECIIVNHPNPPQDYAAQIYVLGGNTILFHFGGKSKAFREKNEYEAVRKGQGTAVQSMKYMFKQPDKMELEQELAWHGRVIDAFNSLIQK